MSESLAAVLPAAAATTAAFAYLNAKYAIWYDYIMFSGGLPGQFAAYWRQRQDRVNVFYKLEERAKDPAFVNKPYIRFEDKEWTFGQTYERALRYGTYFKRKHNLQPKEMVAVDMTNSDEFIFIVYGLWSIGVRPGLINHNLTGAALVHCVKVANARVLLVGDDVKDEINKQDVRKQLGDMIIDILNPALFSEALTAPPERAPDADRSGDVGKDMGLLIYTSGTTGLPKGAIVSWKKMIIASIVSTNSLGTKPDDVFYTCMPLYHSAGTVMGWVHCVQAGATFALGKRFSNKTFWQDVRRHDATMIQYVGEVCRYLLAGAPEIDPVTGENLDKKHKVRLAYGNGLRPDIWNRFKERFNIDTIVEFYAATEAFMATWNQSRNDFSRGAIGRTGLVTGLNMKTKTAIIRMDPETDLPWRDPETGLCQNVARGEIGEWMFNIPDMKTMDELYQGYYKNEKATNSKIIRDVLKKGDGFFRSGDLISWDLEGRVFFHDRIGDTFRWKAENVATTEVSAMMGVHPSVQEANVYGVQLPHHDGRAGCVAITLSEQPTPQLLNSLAVHAQEKLPKYAVPIFLRVNKEVGSAITATMKQQKNNLRDQGVDPAKMGKDEIYWLKNGTYVTFAPHDWKEINSGAVRL